MSDGGSAAHDIQHGVYPAGMGSPHGLDDIAQTMTHKDDIAAWQKADNSARPWTWL